MKHTSLSGPPRMMMDMFKMLPEGTLAELIDNQIYMSPSPPFIHQIIQKKVTKLLDEIIEEPGKGFVIPAPFDVFLDESANAVQPDIVVVLQTNKGKINREGPFKGFLILWLKCSLQETKAMTCFEKRNCMNVWHSRVLAC